MGAAASMEVGTGHATDNCQASRARRGRHGNHGQGRGNCAAQQGRPRHAKRNGRHSKQHQNAATALKWAGRAPPSTMRQEESSQLLRRILQDPVQQERLLLYCRIEWLKEYVGGEEAMGAFPGINIGYHFLLFFLDVQDHKSLQQSDFRALSAQQIFDTYIGHGASRLVPLSRMIVETIRSHFDASENWPALNTFNDAEDVAFDFLAIEVIPYAAITQFRPEDVTTKRGAPATTTVHEGKEQGGKEKNQKKQQQQQQQPAQQPFVVSSTENTAVRATLTKVLADTEYSSSFLEYLRTCEAKHVLSAFYELNDLIESCGANATGSTFANGTPPASHTAVVPEPSSLNRGATDVLPEEGAQEDSSTTEKTHDDQEDDRLGCDGATVPDSCRPEDHVEQLRTPSFDSSSSAPTTRSVSPPPALQESNDATASISVDSALQKHGKREAALSSAAILSQMFSFYFVYLRHVADAKIELDAEVVERFLHVACKQMPVHPGSEVRVPTSTVTPRGSRAMAQDSGVWPGVDAAAAGKNGSNHAIAGHSGNMDATSQSHKEDNATNDKTTDRCGWKSPRAQLSASAEAEAAAVHMYARALRNLRTAVFDSMLRDHFTGYLQSQQYLRLAKRRTSVHSMLATVCPLHDSGLSSSATAISQALEELSAMVNGEHAFVLLRYLESKGASALLHFYTDVLAYREIDESSDAKRSYFAHTLFRLYICKTGSESLSFPTEMRHQILVKVNQPDATMFDTAFQLVCSTLASYWPGFLKFYDAYTHRKVGLPAARGSPILGRVQSCPVSASADAAHTGEETDLSDNDEDDRVGHLSANVLRNRRNTDSSRRKSSTPWPSWRTSLRRLSSARRDDASVALGRHHFHAPLSKHAQQDVPSASSAAPDLDHQTSTASARCEVRDQLAQDRAELLKSVIDNASSCAMLKTFLESEFSSQTLMFWMEAEDFKRTPRSEYMTNRCRKIVHRYVAVQALMPIPINDDVREAILARIKEPHPTMFMKAQEEVFQFLANEQFPRFMASTDWDTVQEMRDQQPQEQERVRRPSMMEGGEVLQVEGMTLETLLRTQAGGRYFKDFCQRTHCEENVFFWFESEDWTNIPGRDFRRCAAQKIVSKYVSDDANMQINIPGVTKRKVLADLDSMPMNLFAKAQQEVLRLMERDTYPKFLRSEQYAQFRDVYADTALARTRARTPAAEQNLQANAPSSTGTPLPQKSVLSRAVRAIGL